MYLQGLYFWNVIKDDESVEILQCKGHYDD